MEKAWTTHIGTSTSRLPLFVVPFLSEGQSFNLVSVGQYVFLSLYLYIQMLNSVRRSSAIGRIYSHVIAVADVATSDSHGVLSLLP